MRFTAGRCGKARSFLAGIGAGRFRRREAVANCRPARGGGGGNVGGSGGGGRRITGRTAFRRGGVGVKIGGKLGGCG